MSTPFEAGERIVLRDQRDRNYLVTLQEGGTFHSHSGALAHEVLIGASEGTQVETAKGMVLFAFRPRFADYALKMKRGAQVVYPKDIGPILIYADVGPGSRVLEAGTGSAALTIALVRAIGPEGSVASYEARDEHREQAERNIEGFFGKIPDNLSLRSGDVATVAGTGERFDRCVLDLPEPWIVLPAVREALDPGAVVCSYLPTTNQTQQTVLALAPHGFLHVETFEILRRSWHVTERSVRPDHRMVAHTGFLTVARRTA